MRALVFRNDVLTFEKNYPLPDLQSGEALIRVLLAGICNTDLEIVRGYMAFQGVLGHEFVGIVEAVHEGPGASPPTVFQMLDGGDGKQVLLPVRVRSIEMSFTWRVKEIRDVMTQQGLNLRFPILVRL